MEHQRPASVESVSFTSAFLVSRCPEWQWLRSPDMAVSLGVEAGSGVAHPEELRSGASLYCGEYMHYPSASNFARLRQGQPADERLTWPVYTTLASLSAYCMPDRETYETVQYIDIIHDIMKNNRAMLDVGLRPGLDSHDEALRRLFLPESAALRRKYLPTFEAPNILTPRQKSITEETLLSPFNFARFLSSQCSAQEIDSIAHMSPEALRAAVIHGIHDIGGAMGHRYPTSGHTLTTPTVVRLLDAASALLTSPGTLGLPDEAVTPELRRLLFYGIRARRFGLETDPQRLDDLQVMQLKSKLRLADLFHCTTKKDFAAVEEGYAQLPPMLQLEIASFHPYAVDYLPSFLRAVSGNEGAASMANAIYQIIQIENDIFLLEGRAAERRGLAPTPYGESVSRFSFRTPEWYPATYTGINFYRLARWYQSNRPQPHEAVPIIYEEHGGVLTPTPVRSRRRSELGFELHHLQTLQDALDRLPRQEGGI